MKGREKAEREAFHQNGVLKTTNMNHRIGMNHLKPFACEAPRYADTGS